MRYRAGAYFPARRSRRSTFDVAQHRKARTGRPGCYPAIPKVGALMQFSATAGAIEPNVGRLGATNLSRAGPINGSRPVHSSDAGRRRRRVVTGTTSARHVQRRNTAVPRSNSLKAFTARAPWAAASASARVNQAIRAGPSGRPARRPLLAGKLAPPGGSRAVPGRSRIEMVREPVKKLRGATLGAPPRCRPPSSSSHRFADVEMSSSAQATCPAPITGAQGCPPARPAVPHRNQAGRPASQT